MTRVHQHICTLHILNPRKPTFFFLHKALATWQVTTNSDESKIHGVSCIIIVFCWSLSPTTILAPVGINKHVEIKKTNFVSFVWSVWGNVFGFKVNNDVWREWNMCTECTIHHIRVMPVYILLSPPQLGLRHVDSTDLISCKSEDLLRIFWFCQLWGTSVWQEKYILCSAWIIYVYI